MNLLDYVQGRMCYDLETRILKSRRSWYIGVKVEFGTNVEHIGIKVEFETNVERQTNWDNIVLVKAPLHVADLHTFVVGTDGRSFLKVNRGVDWSPTGSLFGLDLVFIPQLSLLCRHKRVKWRSIRRCESAEILS